MRIRGYPYGSPFVTCHPAPDSERDSTVAPVASSLAEWSGRDCCGAKYPRQERK